MSNFICQNEVNMVNEPLEVEKPVLECSSEMDKLRCIHRNLSISLEHFRTGFSTSREARLVLTIRNYNSHDY